MLKIEGIYYLNKSKIDYYNRLRPHWQLTYTTDAVQIKFMSKNKYIGDMNFYFVYNIDQSFPEDCFLRDRSKKLKRILK